MLKFTLLLAGLFISGFSFSQNNTNNLAEMSKKEIRSFLAYQNEVPEAALLMQKSNRQKTTGSTVAFFGALAGFAGYVSLNQHNSDSGDPSAAIPGVLLTLASLTVTTTGLIIMGSSKQNFEDSRDIYAGSNYSNDAFLERKVESITKSRGRAFFLMNQEASIEAKNLAIDFEKQKKISSTLLALSTIGLAVGLLPEEKVNSVSILSGLGLVAGVAFDSQSKRKLNDAEDLYQQAIGNKSSSSRISTRDEKVIYESYFR